MDITYIFTDKISDSDGVSKKIKSQVRALRNVNQQVYFCCMNEEKTYFVLNDEKISSIYSKIPKQFSLNKLVKKLKKTNSNYIYIRQVTVTPMYLIFLRQLKKSNKKIIVEIPTYPYDKEFRSVLKKFIDKYSCKYLHNYVDYIVTFSDDKEIWGIPCINISNGIDLDNTKLINKVEDDIITFTSVSICAPWHGIDRFLKSLETYLEQNSSVQVKFNIVGEGVETPKLKQVVNESKYLKDVVVFQGFKSGEELDVIYNETDIGVGCLGNHRKGIYTIQALKNKEYAAKGLPMIFSEDDPGLRNKEYVYRATHDEQLVDIADIILWYQNLKITPEQIRESVKEFSWDNQMKKVMDKINEL